MRDANSIEVAMASGKPAQPLEGKTAVVVTGAIAPYTDRLYGALQDDTGLAVHVLACTALEPQRKWAAPCAPRYRLQALPGLRLHRSYTSHVYVNPGVVAEILRIAPDIVLIDGFSPTMMLAAGTALARGIALGVITDGSVATDPGRASRVHGWMRKVVIPRAAVGIGASADSVRLLRSFGLKESKGFVVPIMSAWDGPELARPFSERSFDVLFSGSIDDERKGAWFFAEVVERCAAMGQLRSVRVIGDGPLRSALQERLQRAGLSTRFDGYLQQADLAEAYSSAKLLLFPSRGDPWGLVANEAILCGTPVVASPHAVSAVELIAPYDAGLVLPLDAAGWASAVSDLLSEPQRWAALQHNHRAASKFFSRDRCVVAMTTALSVGLSA
jgi:glycosyltransferase involved in cell wall biosynthesis